MYASGQVRRPRLLLFNATVPCNQYNLFPCGRMIKVAKLRTGVGSAEMSHLQNCSLKIYVKRALGGGGGVGLWGGGGCQDGCERRIELKFL